MNQVFEASPADAQLRKVGRPRAFEDVDVFKAIRRVLLREGFHDLTLHAVADELNVSTPALARRFGDKRELLGAYFEFTDQGIGHALNSIKERYPSPINQLRARYLFPYEELGIGPEARAGSMAWLEFLIGVRADPSYGSLLEPMTRHWVDGIAAELEAAHEAGELIETDFPRLAYMLSSALFGAMMYWFEHRRGDLHAHQAEVFEFALQPFRGPAYPVVGDLAGVGLTTAAVAP